MQYFTSDAHFYHGNIIKYENRPFLDVLDMNRCMIEKWNAKVKLTDEVYILGDFAFCTGMQANELLDRLTGKKYLIQGNHDSFLRDRCFDRSKFVWIRDYAKLNVAGQKVILFHYPIAVWDCQHHGSIHLYGHIHGNGITQHPLTAELINAYNVGVDVNGFEPVTLEELRNR